MMYMIRELRDITGMTQKEFSNMYGIPLSTLRKWEQGDSSPAPYVLNLIARTLPSMNDSLQKIEGHSGLIFYYDEKKSIVSDTKGNEIIIQENLDGVKPQNLSLYLEELFEGFYDIQEKFNRDCKFDKEDDILWTR